MAKLSGEGTPTRKTKGAIGDIYVDTKTGNQYKCTFAIAIGEEEYEHEWSKVKVDTQKVDTPVSEPVVEQKVTEEVPVIETVTAPEPKKTNYTQFSNKNNK